jgi:hypothetical protein
VLVVIDPAVDIIGTAHAAERLSLPAESEYFSTLVAVDAEGRLGDLDLVAAAVAPPGERRAAVDAANEEIWRLMLGFDVLPDRFERIVSFLNAARRRWTARAPRAPCGSA